MKDFLHLIKILVLIGLSFIPWLVGWLIGNTWQAFITGFNFGRYTEV